MSFPSFGGAKECGQDEHFGNLVEKGREWLSNWNLGAYGY